MDSLQRQIVSEPCPAYQWFAKSSYELEIGTATQIHSVVNAVGVIHATPSLHFLGTKVTGIVAPVSIDS